LATLDGSHNAIAALQSSVSRLGQLSDLNLSANKLVAIPQALASCPKLKVRYTPGV
jgi:Leucine-rich repeat (LRR) protein